MSTTTGRRRTAVGAVLALLAGLGTAAASAGPAAATGDVLIVQKGSAGNLVTLQTFVFLPGITEQGDGVQAGVTQFAVTDLTDRTLTLTERTPAGAVVHSDTVAAGKSGTFAVTAGDTVALTVPAG
ncbi:hypothetical protein ACGFZB_12210 [Streptomyces cinerochromogenes]|uniref:Uncharacterized protein n=1 Tax=Streptomyces cinerochromogenes TaxID=66422 RepID=A0ABW7B220_9ACTN